MSENNSFIRKAFELNKNGVDNIFSAVGTIQEQAEEITLRIMNESPLFPEPAKKIIKSSFDTYRQGRETVQGQVGKSQKAFEELLSAASL